MNPELLFPALSTMLAISIYFAQGVMVGVARNKYGVKAPKTTGNEDFERVFRVHYNTLESLPTFLVSLWFFALLINPTIAGWLGIVWCIGRLGYMHGYYKSAEARHGFGSVISFLALLPLFLGSFWAIIKGML